MGVRKAWRWAVRDWKGGLAAHDPSKLMIAPILFVAVLALLDRAVYEAERTFLPGTPERMTRL